MGAAPWQGRGMAQVVPLSIRDTVGAGLRFVRENWRFVASVAAIAAGLEGVSYLVLGPSLPWMLLLLLITAGAYAALTRAALSGAADVRVHLPGDGGRVAAAMAGVGFFLSIIAIMLTFVAMSVLIAPYEAQVKAAGEDEAALAAIMNQAVAAQPGAIAWIMAIGAALVFLITTRFYLAAPASVAQKRVVVFESWVWTRGAMLKIAGARLLLLLPALIFAGAIQSLAAMALGAPAGDAVALAALAQSNQLLFTAFYAIASFLQIALYSALEAGLSANIYRSLRPPPAPPAA